jgi:maleate isomerase
MESTPMTSILPTARLGVIVSSGNRTVEPYFNIFGPSNLGIYATRMRMGSGGRNKAEDIVADALRSAELLADAGVDVIDLQGTGIMMERGPDGEAAVVKAITDATGIPAFTATQAVVEALNALDIRRVIVINPADEKAIARETAYLEAVGLTVSHAVGMNSSEVVVPAPPEDWVAVAKEHGTANGDGLFLSGSFTAMLEAVAPIEAALGKPVVTSVQAALWAGVMRLSDKIGDYAPPPELGRLFQAA